MLNRPDNPLSSINGEWSRLPSIESSINPVCAQWSTVNAMRCRANWAKAKPYCTTTTPRRSPLAGPRRADDQYSPCTLQIGSDPPPLGKPKHRTRPSWQEATNKGP
eukprot:512259-Prymnesium_polylepis.2